MHDKTNEIHSRSRTRNRSAISDEVGRILKNTEGSHISKSNTGSLQRVSEETSANGLGPYPFIQTELAINSLGNRYELEANRIANRIIHKKNIIRSRIVPTLGTLQDNRKEQATPEQLRITPVGQPLNRSNMAIEAKIGSRIQQSLKEGKDLPYQIRDSMENVLGTEFEGVKIHTDTFSIKLNKLLHARAFTLGQHIFFNQGSYDPASLRGQKLLVHELIHVIQQSKADIGIIQRWNEAEQGPAPNSPEELAGGVHYHVVVIGSPGPGEVQAGHWDQFIRAAERYRGLDCIWLVERTGYDFAHIDSNTIIQRSGQAPVFWIDESSSLSLLLNSFPRESIEEMHVFSHGLAGLISLRYGWPEHENYGLSLQEVQQISGFSFAPDARLQFDSCNTGTETAEGNLAQEIADETGAIVYAWTGRTSYHAVNVEEEVQNREVTASEVRSYNWDALWESYSRLRGRHPRLATFRPSLTVTDFQAPFMITARLPSTRLIAVGQNGGLHVIIRSHSPIESVNGYHYYARLHLRHSDGSEEEIGDRRTLTIGEANELYWSNLSDGNYFVEIYHFHRVPVVGTIYVHILR